MLIGRSDDPHSPRRVAAFEVSVPFGSGSRNPSGPAARCRANRPDTRPLPHRISNSSTLAPCTQRAVHTRPMAYPTAASGIGLAGRPGGQIGRPLACEELTANAQPSGPARSNASWMRPRRIGDGDNPFSA